MIRAILTVGVGLTLLAASCSRGDAAGAASSPRMLVGAGATLPYPLYSKWADEYSRIDPAVRVNYQSIGSGAGIRQVAGGIVDFGATDEPMSDEQIRHASTRLVLVPTVVGAVVFAFNLPGTRDLALSPELAADIFLGNVRRWDDERLRALNPGRALPSDPILVVHRADGSGTSAALTRYLSAHSEAWRATIGAGTTPRFPVGVGAKGNEGVTALVKSTPLSIAYIELVYARQAGLAMAKLRNPAGALVGPTRDALERASMSASRARDGERVVLLDAADEGAYPLVAISYVVLPLDAPDRRKAEALAKFLWWAVHDGQRVAPDLDYVALPPVLTARAEHVLRALRGGGQPLGLPAGDAGSAGAAPQ